MSAFLYDGTVEGFLTALSASLDRDEAPEAISPEKSWTPSLFDEQVIIKSNSEIAHKLVEKIENKISHRAVRHVFYCFCSEIPDIGGSLYEYLKKGFEYGAKVDGFHANKSVSRILDISKQVGAESHRLKGLVRFRKLENIFFLLLLSRILM